MKFRCVVHLCCTCAVLVRGCKFPEGWDTYVDKLGDGHKIIFPIYVRKFLSWGPKTYHLVNGALALKPRYYQEKVSICFSTSQLTVFVNLSTPYCVRYENLKKTVDFILLILKNENCNAFVLKDSIEMVTSLDFCPQSQ